MYGHGCVRIEAEYRSGNTVKEFRVLQLMIDLIERQQKKVRGYAKSPILKA